MQTIKLSLTVEEINTILEALGQMPYSRVYQLIGKIQQQAQRQLQDEGGRGADDLGPPRDSYSERGSQ
jgi:hypothetical protein